MQQERSENDADKAELEQRKTVVMARDERTAMNRAIRSAARADVIYELFQKEIRKYDAPNTFLSMNFAQPEEKAIYALLSDIHYGLTFQSVSGSYSSDLAKDRVCRYAQRIIDAGREQGAPYCYVSLLGDLVSGMIHTSVRLENKENLVEQVIGVSELVACFLNTLARSFRKVIVNHVPGNHSRVDLSPDMLRKEKLDSLIPWYCRTKLENVSNVVFLDNEIDNTVASFEIFGKNYVAVHGDYDGDLSATAHRLSVLTGKAVDYVMAGHLHVPDIRLENVGFIRNGSVCGSGDDYTMRKRLFAPPYQVFVTCTAQGIEGIFPVCLEE